MKNIIIVLALILCIADVKANSESFYLLIDKDACYTCNATLVNNVMSKCPKSLNATIIITGVTSNNLRFYKKDIDSIFREYNVIYDTARYYRNAFNIKNRIEFIISSKDNKSFQSFTNANDVIAQFRNISQNSEIASLKKLNSIEYDEEFLLINAVSFYKNDFLIFFDKRQKLFFFFNQKNQKKYSVAISKALDMVDTKINLNNPDNKNFHNKDLISFLGFVQSEDSRIRFHSYVIDTVINESTAIIKIYIFTLNEKGFLDAEELVFPSNFIFHGNNELIELNGNYYASVFDKRYHHSRHEIVKDTTSIFIELSGNEANYNSIINYSLADKLTGSKYGLFFMSSYYLFDNKLYFISAENGIFSQFKNGQFSNFLKYSNELELLLNSQKNADKDKYLNGEYYSRNCLYDFVSFAKNSKYYCILLFEYPSLIDNNKNKFKIQLYDLNGNYVTEINSNCDMHDKVYLLKIDDELILMNANDEKLDIFKIDIKI